MNIRVKLILVFCMMFVVESFAEPKGWGAGLGTFDGKWGGQVRKGFIFGDDLQFGVDLQAGLYNQRKWTGRFDADFHYIFMPKNTFSLYPLVGADFALQDGRHRWGANLGGGALVDLNADTSLFFEIKYVAGDWNGYAFTGGIFF